MRLALPIVLLSLATGCQVETPPSSDGVDPVAESVPATQSEIIGEWVGEMNLGDGPSGIRVTFGDGGTATARPTAHTRATEDPILTQRYAWQLVDADGAPVVVLRDLATGTTLTAVLRYQQRAALEGDSLSLVRE